MVKIDRMPEELRGATWRGFTIGMPEGEAVGRFQKLYGREPEMVVEDKKYGLWWVGPVERPVISKQ